MSKIKKVYIKHDIDARNNPGLIRLRKNFGWGGVGIYWAIIEILRGMPELKLPIPIDDDDDLLLELEMSKKDFMEWFEKATLKPGLSQALMAYNSDHFWSDRLIEDVNETERVSKIFSEAGRKGGQKSKKNRLKTTKKISLAQATLKPGLSHPKATLKPPLSQAQAISTIEYNHDNSFVNTTELSNAASLSIDKKAAAANAQNIAAAAASFEVSRRAKQLAGKFLSSSANQKAKLTLSQMEILAEYSYHKATNDNVAGYLFAILDTEKESAAQSVMLWEAYLCDQHQKKIASEIHNAENSEKKRIESAAIAERERQAEKLYRDFEMLPNPEKQRIQKAAEDKVRQHTPNFASGIAKQMIKSEIINLMEEFAWQTESRI